MILSKKTLSTANPKVQLNLPKDSSFELPEKVLQFGTGVLLRGLPDYFIDLANKKQIFNGRVVMVKSTSLGDIDLLKEQDNLYTLCIRGVDEGETIKNNFLNNSVSRILKANEEWDEVLQCARNENIRIVISNTTEIGIQLNDDDIHATPPESFPGKLLALLYERYKAFNGDYNKGMVIIPTELIVNNGDKLKSILTRLSEKNKLSEDFIQWLQECNAFCNSLVDRIVPGKPANTERETLEDNLGYTDRFLIKAEPYRLWAIEVKDEWVARTLSFSEADKGVILAKDISKFRELKLRLLNATHTFTCALAYLNGFETVKAAVEDEDMGDYIQSLMDEIAYTIVDGNISMEEARIFSTAVIDRFKNPFIVHQWLSISLQYSTKIKMRCVPLLLSYYKKTKRIPDAMSRGLAAYILFMKSKKNKEGKHIGIFGNKDYPINDDKAELLYKLWNNHPNNIIRNILSDTDIWGENLDKIPYLAEKIEAEISMIYKSNP